MGSAQNLYNYTYNKLNPGQKPPSSDKVKAGGVSQQGVHWVLVNGKYILQSGQGGGSAYSPSGSSGGSSGSSGGGYGRGGGSGGGSGGVKKAPLNLKVYHPLDYSNKGVKSRAKLQAAATNREGYTANQLNRNSAENTYESAIRGMDYQQNIDERNLGQQHSATQAGNANTALNRGMGFGQGYQNVQVAADNANEQAVSDLLNQYLVQRNNALGDRNTVYGNMDEQDRLIRANRLATIDKLFAQYDDTAYNRYLKNEALRQASLSSANQRLSTHYSTS